MSGESSSAAGWFTRLEPAQPLNDLPERADDPRLGQVVEFWRGDPDALKPGRGVLVGFPQDAGVRRNHGRDGAAEAPREIRRWLYCLTPYDTRSNVDLAARPLLDAGDVRIAGNLEETQQALGQVIGAILKAGAVPIVLGGGHETAYGHYLGYVHAQRRVGIMNFDAHLDLRPTFDGEGHSGSPFRQALEHPTQPLPGNQYVCLGAQPFAVSREHVLYARQKGCVVRWCGEVRGNLTHHWNTERDRLVQSRCHVYVSVDADVVQAADVPGVSAPNPLGLPGADVVACATLAGRAARISSFEVVEVNPRYDVDGRSARWAALVVWHFLIGLAGRQA